MCKEQWIEARERVIERRLEEFEAKVGHPASLKEIEEIENNVTEDEITDEYAGYDNEDYDDLILEW